MLGGGGTPAKSDWGYPLARTGWGVPQPGELSQPEILPWDWGTRSLGYPPAGMGPPGRDWPPCRGTPQDRTGHGVLDAPRSVCLLRSRRRIFGDLKLKLKLIQCFINVKYKLSLI